MPLQYPDFPEECLELWLDGCSSRILAARSSVLGENFLPLKLPSTCLKANGTGVTADKEEDFGLVSGPSPGLFA